jgi:hypothetical protein
MNQQQRAMWIKVGELLEEYDMAGSSFAEDLQAALNQLLEQSALAQERDRVRECAKRLVEHADFKLGGALSADSKAKDIPSNAISNVKARHLAALRDALEATPPAQLAAWVGLIRGVRVDGDSVVISTKGNETARKLCEVLLKQKDAV